MNRIFKQLAAVLLALVLLACTALAALPDRLIPGGQANGQQQQTDGVSIVMLSRTNTPSRQPSAVLWGCTAVSAALPPRS